MTSSVGSIPAQIPKAVPATFKALFVAVTAGLGYGFDSYAVNIYGLVLPEIKLFPTVLRGTGFGIAVGGGRIVSIAAPTVIGWAITQYGLQTPYLALAGLWVLTMVGYLLGPETKGKELEDPADEALTEDLEPVKN